MRDPEKNASRNVLAIINFNFGIGETLKVGKKHFTEKKNLKISMGVWRIALWQERLASNLILNKSDFLYVGR